MFEYDLDKLKTPHCELGKMNTDNSCDNHCPWYEPDNKPIEQHNIPKS